MSAISFLRASFTIRCCATRLFPRKSGDSTSILYILPQPPDISSTSALVASTSDLRSWGQERQAKGDCYYFLNFQSPFVQWNTRTRVFIGRCNRFDSMGSHPKSLMAWNCCGRIAEGTLLVLCLNLRWFNIGAIRLECVEVPFC